MSKQEFHIGGMAFMTWEACAFVDTDRKEYDRSMTGRLAFWGAGGSQCGEGHGVPWVGTKPGQCHCGPGQAGPGGSHWPHGQGQLVDYTFPATQG